MANFYGASKLAGGTAGALDDIDYSSLSTGDGAMVIDATSDTAYCYTYDATVSDAESLPDILKPDNNSGNGRWMMTGMIVGDLTAAAATFTSLVFASGATVSEFSTDITMAGDSDTAVPTEGAVRAWSHGVMPGHCQLGEVTCVANGHTSAWDLVISPSNWHIYSAGNGHRHVYITSDATIDTVAVSGSNTWYVYIDDSAISSTLGGTITASEMYISATDPTLGANGWYNGDDRAVAIFSTVGGVVQEFAIKSHGYLALLQDITIRGLTDLDTAYEESLCLGGGGPVSLIKMAFRLYCITDTSNTTYCRPTGHTGTGVRVALQRTGGETINTCDVQVSSTGGLEIANFSAGDSQVALIQHGYYLPHFM